MLDFAQHAKLTQDLASGRGAPLIVRDDDSADFSGCCLHYMPGSVDMGRITRQMEVEMVNPSTNLNITRCLSHLVAMYAERYKYDLILFDLASDLYALNKCALLSSDFILIPCMADPAPALSFRVLADAIFPTTPELVNPHHMYNRFQSRVKVMGFVVSCGMNFKTQDQLISTLLRAFQHTLYSYVHAPAALPSTMYRTIPLLREEHTNDAAAATTSLMNLHLPEQPADTSTNTLLREQLTSFVEWLRCILAA